MVTLNVTHIGHLFNGHGPRTDEFNTGVEYVVACEASCHCQFSGISLFCKKRKLFLILDASGGLWRTIALCFPI